MRAWERETVVRTIAEKLAPFVGATMATHATRLHCDRVAGTGGSLSRPQIEELLSALAPGLKVFIGEGTTKEAFFHVRCALDLPGVPR